ncbi:MAG TPA: SAM-dependent DNA methyltransferase, partial [Flavobacteriaceae bacterium]|nr:SAM-dependent DNA methyltransferase [Flavobacteriaceae bacterium]
MITKDNFKDVLEKLGFTNSKDIYTKKFDEFNTQLKVDFKDDEEKLIYPETDGLKVNDKTTSNFTSAENFVVFECVCKLLSQGYNPKHIELEPKWQVGHGASGGKADILIKDNKEKTLLIIECKTAGSEFKKAWDSTQIKPTQLFSYAQQDRDTKFIALYASDFVDDEIKSDYYLISLSDDNKRLFENKSLKSYSDANTVENIYNVWSETYKKEFKTNGLFEENKAYFIGIEKTNINDLKIVSSNDIKGKYNEFATIMRQHNIGGAERAFNVLVNLFLCKIIDENKNIKNDKSGLEFYWKGISYDDAFSLQDRLQELYKIGMFDFLNEEITYISDKAIDDMFKIIDLDSLKIDVKSKFREQKFFTNNDFSFLDVHSEELFYKNFEVLLKVVEMFQDIRLTGVKDNQFLGDMFEGFLDNGVKQSEGQFFTPMPIVKFIINSLPLDEIQKIHNEPKAIDYACGAGHFLNEVAKVFTSNEVIGIEKEYRLSKVAKVSALMYGQDNINIIYNDALTKSKEIENDSFSVLVANPPYSVKGFLETLPKDDIENYELTKTIEEKSYTANNSIECFFVEKGKQLLCAGAVAGIVLPSSILSKGDGKNTYVGTREILIKYFEIVAIAEFGSGTFGKTGTNTVTLFLKRRDDTQNIVGRYKDFVDNLFINNKNTGELFKDKYLIEDYCTHINIEQNIYLSMFENELNQDIFNHETFTEYK